MKPITTLTIGIASGFALGVALTHLFNGRHDALLTEDAPAGIGIPEFVSRVRDELIASERQRLARNEPALLAAKTVQLEISFIARRKVSAGGKVSLEVVDLNASDEVSNEQVQKMTLNLEIQPPEEVTIPPSL